MLPNHRRAISSSAAILVLAVTAALAGVWVTSPAAHNLVPIIFAAMVVLVALRYGALAGILGSFVIAAVFTWLSAPTGSLRVHDAVARDRIGWMLLAGISLSYLLAAPVLSDRDHKR